LRFEDCCVVIARFSANVESLQRAEASKSGYEYGAKKRNLFRWRKLGRLGKSLRIQASDSKIGEAPRGSHFLENPAGFGS